jgi:hypothetical protein
LANEHTRTGRCDAEQQPVPVRQTPTTNKTAFGDSTVSAISSHVPRVDERSPRHNPGVPLDKELKSMERRRAAGLQPGGRTYLGPIDTPAIHGVPEAEQRRTREDRQR